MNDESRVNEILISFSKTLPINTNGMYGHSWKRQAEETKLPPRPNICDTAMTKAIFLIFTKVFVKVDLC